MKADNPIILVIEDEKITRDIIIRTINSAVKDSICLEAGNGKVALKELTKIRSMYAKDPDLIICDLEMPIMDGWGFLEEMRKGNYCPKVKVAILSSSARSSDKEKAENYDCVIEYIEKPLTQEKVETIRNKLTVY